MRQRRRLTDWSTARKSCSGSLTINKRQTRSFRASWKPWEVRWGKQSWTDACTDVIEELWLMPFVSVSGVRAAPHHFSVLLMTTTTTTLALTVRHTSAHPQDTSAPRVRRTSYPPSLCKWLFDQTAQTNTRWLLHNCGLQASVKVQGLASLNIICIARENPNTTCR